MRTLLAFFLVLAGCNGAPKEPPPGPPPAARVEVRVVASEASARHMAASIKMASATSDDERCSALMASGIISCETGGAPCASEQGVIVSVYGDLASRHRHHRVLPAGSTRCFCAGVDAAACFEAAPFDAGDDAGEDAGQ